MSGTEGRLAIVEDDRLLLDQLVFALKGTFDVVTAEDAVSGLALVAGEPDLFLIDLRLPPSRRAEEGIGLLSQIRSKRPEAAVVVMTGEADRRYALRAVELGAFDFFRKPVEKADLLFILRRALERSRLLAENRALKDEMLRGRSFDRLVGTSPPMRALFAKIGRVASSDATVLLQGESGTGKELVAEAIHRGSPRSGNPFVAVNGSALPESLAESELFGHEKGAFTGAVAVRPGKFELAHGGTLFLDEVATLTPAIQSKLLRVLESRAFERIGGRKTIAVDIRLIAATNDDLARLVAKGVFREDLFYRLNTVVLQLPPLRERSEDIPLLVDFFAVRAARRHGRPTKTFTRETLEAMKARPFPGNVRELEHLVEMLTLMVEEDTILPGHLPASGPGGAEEGGADLPLAAAVARFEKELLVRAIARTGGVKARAAEALGLDSNQMKYLCRKYGL
ncbi:MAG TPA: sigma-54 dependent transcriptional regulator [Thermoanaerobaculia bacterium]|nr:sigma-54 dependent transcriptional regulator [Thermoanaerobaculia bacterium]